MRLTRLLTALAVPVVSVLALAAPAATTTTTTTGHRGPNNMTTLARFDHAAGDTPENIVITRHEVVVSLAFASTVAVLEHSGRRVQSLRLDTASGFVAALALDHRGHALAIAVSSPDAAVAGAYEGSSTGPARDTYTAGRPARRRLPQRAGARPGRRPLRGRLAARHHLARPRERASRSTCTSVAEGPATAARANGVTRRQRAEVPQRHATSPTPAARPSSRSP